MIARSDRVGHMTVPITRPGKIVCVGLNYKDHAEEQGAEPAGRAAPLREVHDLPDRARRPDRHPARSSRSATTRPSSASSSAAPSGTSRRRTRSRRSPATSSRTTSRPATSSSPTGSGRAASRPTRSARSARSCRRPTSPTRTRSGSARSSTGRRVQDSTTANLIFGIDEIISYVSQTSTLEEGDLILTGTPAGVGVFRDPQRLLQPGDEITIEIDGVGVADEPGGRPSRLRSAATTSPR